MPKRPPPFLHRAAEAVQRVLDDPALILEGKATWLHRFVHFWLTVWRSFVRNRCPLRASALSYTTLLALVPMLAVAVSVTSSLLKNEGTERIYQFVDRFVSSVMPPAVVETNAVPSSATTNPPTALASATNSPAEETNRIAAVTGAPPGGTNAPASGAGDQRVVTAQRKAAAYIHDFLRKTSSATLGVTGMLALVYLAIILLTRIEETFNDIWGVTRGRSWVARVIQYWATITLGPLLLVVGTGLAGSAHLEAARRLIAALGFPGQFLFRILPLLVLWLTFSLFYVLMPNTKVKWSAAAVGGAMGSVLWFANNAVGFLYVSRVVTNSKLYGGLGLVPVFMLGLYASWFILLWGAQVSYAWQNRAAYAQERLTGQVNQRGREFVALRLMTAIGQHFQRGQKPPAIPELAVELGIPSRLIQQVLQTLLSAKLVIEIAGPEGGFAPARPLEAINCHHVLLALRASSGQELTTRDEPARTEVFGEFARIQEAEEQAASSVTLRALVNRVEARLELALPAGEVEVQPADVARAHSTPTPQSEQESAALKPRDEAGRATLPRSPDLSADIRARQEPRPTQRVQAREASEDSSPGTRNETTQSAESHLDFPL